MKVLLEDVRSAPGRAVRLSVAWAVDSGVEDVPFVAPARGEVTVRAEGARLRLSGRVGTRARLVCGRCLAAFEAPLVAELDEWLDPELEPGEEVLVEDGVLVMPLEGPEVDVAEIVRQHLVLAIPYAPLCRADCAGLCPVCGADRNHNPCRCPQRAPDPRWEVLRTALGGQA
jgi:uncharacterized protein